MPKLSIDARTELHRAILLTEIAEEITSKDIADAGVGKIFTERFYLSDAAMKRLNILAKRAGLISDNDFGSRRTVNWAALVGKHLVVEIVEEEYEGKKGKAKRSKVSYAGVWSLTDDRVRDVPRDQNALRVAAQPSANGSQPTSRPAARTATAGAWGEI
jgi:hypothetical protein